MPLIIFLRLIFSYWTLNANLFRRQLSRSRSFIPMPLTFYKVKIKCFVNESRDRLSILVRIIRIKWFKYYKTIQLKNKKLGLLLSMHFYLTSIQISNIILLKNVGFCRAYWLSIKTIDTPATFSREFLKSFKLLRLKSDVRRLELLKSF